VNNFSGFLNFVYVGGVQYDAIDTFFKDFGHQFGLLTVFDLHHYVFASAGKEVLNGNNGPVEHSQDNDFFFGDGGGFVFVGFAGYVDEFDVDAGLDVAVFFDGFDFAKLADGITFAIRQNYSLSAAFQG
jgi:hypothetical protein